MILYSIQFTHEPDLETVDGPKRLFRILMDWAVLINGDVLVIPAGFETDGATIPPRLESLIDNDDPRIFKPSILHDYLCDYKGDIWPDHRVIYDSVESAAILRDAMAACGASEAVRDIVFVAVAMEGPHWK